VLFSSIPCTPLPPLACCGTPLWHRLACFAALRVLPLQASGLLSWPSIHVHGDVHADSGRICGRICCLPCHGLSERLCLCCQGSLCLFANAEHYHFQEVRLSGTSVGSLLCQDPPLLQFGLITTTLYPCIDSMGQQL
jgi:hypothetical protein